MTQSASVELFFRVLEANNAGDVEATIALSAEDIVIWAGRSPVGGEYRGHEGVRQFHADNAENFEVWHLEYPDVRAQGEALARLRRPPRGARRRGARELEPFGVKDGLDVVAVGVEQVRRVVVRVVLRS
jgi:SnoaL-like protein